MALLLSDDLAMTGIEPLDHDHLRLAGTLNALYEAVTNRNRPEAEALLFRLREQIHLHSLRERQLFEDSGAYPADLPYAPHAATVPLLEQLYLSLGDDDAERLVATIAADFTASVEENYRAVQRFCGVGPVGQEQRAFERHDCFIEVVAVDQRDEYPGRVLDLSQGGCLVKVTRGETPLEGRTLDVRTRARDLACTVLRESDRGCHCTFGHPLSRDEVAEVLANDRAFLAELGRDASA